MLQKLLTKITGCGSKGTITPPVADSTTELASNIKDISSWSITTGDSKRARTFLDLPIAIRQRIYWMVMRRGRYFKHHVKAHTSVPCRLPAVCFTSHTERQIAMAVYIRNVCFEIGYTPLHLQAFLSQVAGDLGFAAVRRVVVTCMPRPSDTDRKNLNRVSRVHMDVLNKCTGLETLKFIVCMPMFSPLALSFHWLKEFYEVEKMLKMKALRKVTWDIPKSHKKCEVSVNIFRNWLVEEFKKRNGQEVEVVVEWCRL